VKIEIPLGFFARGRRFWKRGKVSEVVVFAVNLYDCAPLVCVRAPMHPDGTGIIVAGDFLVAVVCLVTGLAQVGQAVVRTVAVYVVYLIRWPRTRGQRPRSAVRQNQSVIQTALPVTPVHGSESLPLGITRVPSFW